MPARLVIDREGIVRAVDADPDYTVRPEPEKTLADVKKLSGSRRMLSATSTPGRGLRAALRCFHVKVVILPLQRWRSLTCGISHARLPSTCERYPQRSLFFHSQDRNSDEQQPTG
jgi:hypothetical protein